MVHHRINERETNPNPHVNFITALPMPEVESQEEARRLLRALAAQVRPVMKTHGLEVNSLEEYEYNEVFAGRNWNAGETVELVLRRPNGGFFSNSWLLSTLCHELAHIKHMNHGPAFQALWRQLNNEVHTLQSKGYFGDGYWSSGKRLLDSSTVGGQGIDTGDLPEYMCGGAQSRARPARTRRKRRREAGPSKRTGAQTAKRRQAGSRVTAEGVFRGKGAALNEDVDDEESKRVGTGFRKKAGSKRARDERALAAERRLNALRDPSRPKEESSSSDEESSDELLLNPETNQDRRRTMRETMKESELNGLKTSAHDFFKDFVLLPPRKSRLGEDKDPRDLIDLTGDNEPEAPFLRRPTAPEAGPSAKKSATNNLQKSGGASSSKQQSLLDQFVSNSSSGQQQTRSTRKFDPLGSRSIVKDEVDLRKKESLGLALSGRKLGSAPVNIDRKQSTNGPQRNRQREEDSEWACDVCTLLNEPDHLACSACGTARAKSWLGI